MFLDTTGLRSEEICLRLDRTVEGNPEKDFSPTYYFSICTASDGEAIGTCDLRIGHTRRLYYGGNIGYSVNEPHRGNHYAGKACLLLFGLARNHGMDYLYITCNPDNYASRKTCEYAGGVLEAIVDIPEDNDMYQDGERQKCIYRFELG